jgi:glycosyltransferase involved in cell wall biosynthesis
MIGEFARTDAIICVAEKAKANFVSRYPDLAKKTHLIYNFFDNDSIVRMGDEPFSYGDDRFVMLSVGRLTSPKQYPRFLDVLAHLRGDGYDFAWHILGVGAEYDAISRKMEKLGLGDCVFLDGVTENPYKYMKNCDLFVLPSGWEGFPTVTVEAKILDCPVLATDVSGIREQMTHGETGWIVENSEDGLYSGLKHLLDNPTLIEKLRSNQGMENILDNDRKFAEFEVIYSGK